jgi:hypothetical protein
MPTSSRFLNLAAALVTLAPAIASGAEIVSPPAGTLVTPGASVTMVVAPAAGEEISQVAFVTSEGTTQAAAGSLQANVPIPQSAVGPEFVMAYVRLANGKVDVPSVRLLANPGPLRDLMVAGPPLLDRIGQVIGLRVTGRFADGVVRDLTDSERGTTYQSTNDAVLGVHDSGTLQARSRGVAQVIVTSHGKSSVLTVPVRVPSPPDNHIPVPNAGPDLTMAREQFVELNGNASADEDGDPIRYAWQQQSGPRVLLRDADTANPFFVTPFVTQQSDLVFSLVVVDSRGATSYPDTVRITVTP